MGEQLTYVFLGLFCEKNSDGTKNLRLMGNELNYRLGKRLTDSDMKKISYFLTSNPLVVKLDLAYNNISDEGLKILVEEHFAFPNNITHLSLVCNNITHIGIEALCSARATLGFKTLRLTGNKIGLGGAAALRNFIETSTTLEHLDVGDTDQTIASVTYFCESLLPGFTGNTSLRTIDISNIIPMCYMYQACPTQLAAHLGQMLKVNKTLVELHVQKCQLDGHDVDLLINGLKLNKTLLLLDIAFNRIGNYGAEILSEYLKLGPKIIGLNIAGNNIGDNGAKALCIGVPFSRLRMLDISKNKMSDIGISAVLTTLRKTGQMLSLCLWGNEIGTKSIKIMERHFKSGMYKQENVDFKIYIVDMKLHVAFYPSNQYKHRYYSQLDPHQVRELRIRRNKIPSQYCNEKAKLNFKFYDRIEGSKECNDVTYDPSDTNWKKKWTKQIMTLTDNPLEDRYKVRFSNIPKTCSKSYNKLHTSYSDPAKRYKALMRHYSVDDPRTRITESKLTIRRRYYSV